MPCPETQARRIFKTNSFLIPGKIQELSPQEYLEESDDLHRLYAKALYINHSCEPNAFYRFSKDLTFVLFALRNVAPNEEITVSYMGLDLLTGSIESREKIPRGVRQFDCQCAACKAGKVVDNSKSSHEGYADVVSDADLSKLEKFTVVDQDSKTRIELANVLAKR